MPRFNSLRELDEWRQQQGTSSARTVTPEPDALPAPDPQPNENTAPKPSGHTPPSAMSMDSMPPMPAGSFIMRFRRLLPALIWVAAAIAVLFIWSLFAPFTAAIATWIGSNILSLGMAILAIVIAGYLAVLHHHVHEVLPQYVLTLRSDVMRRLDAIEISTHPSGQQLEEIEQPENTATASQEQTPMPSQEHTPTIQKEFEQWMQSEQPTPSP